MSLFMRMKIKKPKALTKHHSPNEIDFGSLKTVEIGDFGPMEISAIEEKEEILGIMMA